MPDPVVSKNISGSLVGIYFPQSFISVLRLTNAPSTNTTSAMRRVATVARGGALTGDPITRATIHLPAVPSRPVPSRVSKTERDTKVSVHLQRGVPISTAAANTLNLASSSVWSGSRRKNRPPRPAGRVAVRDGTRPARGWVLVRVRVLARGC